MGQRKSSINLKILWRWVCELQMQIRLRACPRGYHDFLDKESDFRLNLSKLDSKFF